MKNNTPFLAGFHIKTLGRKRLGTAQKMVCELARLKHKNLSQLSECFRGFIPQKQLRPSENKAHSRCRLFSKQNTFWAFFAQVIDADKERGVDESRLSFKGSLQALRQWFFTVKNHLI